jgi:hypothetical protein
MHDHFLFKYPPDQRTDRRIVYQRPMANVLEQDVVDWRIAIVLPLSVGHLYPHEIARYIGEVFWFDETRITTLRYNHLH